MPFPWAPSHIPQNLYTGVTSPRAASSIEPQGRYAIVANQGSTDVLVNNFTISSPNMWDLSVSTLANGVVFANGRGMDISMWVACGADISMWD